MKLDEVANVEVIGESPIQSFLKSFGGDTFLNYFNCVISDIFVALNKITGYHDLFDS